MLKSGISESAPLVRKPGILLLPSSRLHLSLFPAEEHALMFCQTLEGEEINDDE